MTDQPRENGPRLEPIPYATPQRRSKRVSTTTWILIASPFACLILVAMVLPSFNTTRVDTLRSKSASNLKPEATRLIVELNAGHNPPRAAPGTK